MSKIRISAVSYTNTKPFVYGLLKHPEFLEKIDLSLDIPAECAQKLIDDKADIGLVPVAALLKIPDYHIISDYCIGAVGPVNSVFIFSSKPIEDIQTIRLDKQSRTSNNLARVLLKNYWKKHPAIVETAEADAFVEIGDRTFGKKGSYAYEYDLAEEWMKFTGLPFAFAVWASNKPVSNSFVTEFNEVLKFGLNHRKEVIAELPKRNDFDLDDYLMSRIDYDLTAEKREALNRFLTMVKELD
ncbi:radical SAM protein [Pedobacter sp. HMF7647]|uniref:Chorismate dehydratase n=1 Tax=Hufsiella arboris TaxID=2695275 RepID=A0A7K1YC62_9SPHI|nr:radical SAM protein [Hufsiella arboris]